MNLDSANKVIMEYYRPMYVSMWTSATIWDTDEELNYKYQLKLRLEALSDEEFMQFVHGVIESEKKAERKAQYESLKQEFEDE